MRAVPTQSVSKDRIAQLLRVLGIGFSIALGIWLGLRLVWMTKQLGGHLASSPGLVLSLYAGGILLYLLNVPIHEFGHWLGAKRSRFRCQKVAVLWLHLECKGEQWKFRWGARNPGTLGHIVALPTDFVNFRHRQAIYLLAGPIANLLTGLPLILLGSYLQNHSFPVTNAVFLTGQVVLVFGVLALFQGVINLLPMTVRTDGTKLLEIWRNGPAWHRQVAMQQITAVILRYVRPRQWESEWISPLLALTDQSAAECMSHFYAYAYALDTGDQDAACSRLQRAADLLQKVGPVMQQLICCEVLYCNVMLVNAPEQASQWLACADQAKTLAPHEKPFTRAIVAYSQQNSAEARYWLQQYEKELATLPVSSVKEQAYELLAKTRVAVELLPAPADISINQASTTPPLAARPAAAG